MPPIRRLWDSSVVIGYLAGYQDLYPECTLIIQQAERREVEILVSEMAKAETAYLAGRSDNESEDLIREFFGREYIVPVSVDDPVSTIARNLIRRYRNGPKLKPPDAIHLATAILWRVPIIETTDPDLLHVDGREGDPAITVRKPLFEGTRTLL